MVRHKFEHDPHAAPWHSVEFRFYEELNDFLPEARRKQAFEWRFRGTPSVKDTIELLHGVHLGTLARCLRLLGFDTRWRNDLDDETIAALARDERRIILTRDKGILKDGRVTHGYWLRATDPLKQVEERPPGRCPCRCSWYTATSRAARVAAGSTGRARIARGSMPWSTGRVPHGIEFRLFSVLCTGRQAGVQGPG